MKQTVYCCLGCVNCDVGIVIVITATSSYQKIIRKIFESSMKKWRHNSTFLRATSHQIKYYTCHISARQWVCMHVEPSFMGDNKEMVDLYDHGGRGGRRHEHVMIRTLHTGRVVTSIL